MFFRPCFCFLSEFGWDFDKSGKERKIGRYQKRVEVKDFEREKLLIDLIKSYASCHIFLPFGKLSKDCFIKCPLFNNLASLLKNSKILNTNHRL